MLYQLTRRLNALNPTTYGLGTLALLAETYGSRPPEGSWTIESGVVMRLNMSEYIERSIFLGSFERLTRRVILDRLRPDSVFLDIGANVGYYSLLVRAKLGRSGRVLAFEPNPKMVARLRANIELSSAPGIEIFALALSNDSGRATLFSPGLGNQGEASLVNQGWGEYEQYDVPVRRLDDCLPPDLERIDLIKIDVEGAEALVFEGAKRTIMRFGPSILLEINERAARSFAVTVPIERGGV